METQIALPAPLAVWDTNDWSRWPDWPEASQWAIEHFPERARYIVRAEFYLVDAPFAILHRVAHDAEGRIMATPDRQGPVLDKPLTLMLDELPPEHLLVTP